MRKFWGWVLFVFVVLVARLTQINLSGRWGDGEINWFIAVAWWLVGLVALFGWYRLVVRKSHKEANNAHK